MNILESCILTIIACTWTIHHPNVPGGAPRTRLGTFLHHLKWMALTILIPEFILAQSIDEHLWVRKTWKEMEKKEKHKSSDSKKRFCGITRKETWKLFSAITCKETWKRRFDVTSKETLNWSKKHLYYANMGGFRVRLWEGVDDDAGTFPLTSGELVRYLNPGSNNVPREHPTRSQTPLAAEEPSKSQEPSTPTESSSQHDLSVGSGIEAPISETQIERMIKQDAFLKVIAFLQISWIILSTSCRRYLRISTSQLEILTLAFAVCAVLTYLIRWNKPQNVEIWTEIPNGSKNLNQLSEPNRFFKTITYLWRHGGKHKRRAYFRNDTLRPYYLNSAFLPWLVVFMVAIGGLHLISWDFSFPSNTERDLWSLAPLPLVWIQDYPNMKSTKKIKNEPQRFIKDCEKLLRGFEKKIDRRLEKNRNDSDLEKKKNPGSEENPGLKTEKETNEALKIQVGETLHKLTSAQETREKYRNVFGASLSSELYSYVQRHWNRVSSETSPSFPTRFTELHDKLHSVHFTAHDGISQEILATYDSIPIFDKDFDRTDVFPNLTSKWRRGSIRRDILTYVTPLVGALYSIARLIIIAIAFSSLRSMPTDVYKATWTTYLVKFG
ncbi:unnamed protein product [Clonostachys byssicola]|uniref:Uncharacterized protein n=1 Tax=Clonostachys byssicola TaxID=160290 RepID=A0A9N9U8B1_9HYPO|nr:unnamed protein product [Clonostachys byssicola]